MRPREIGVSAVSTGAATYECTTVVTADLDALVARVAELEADNARMREALESIAETAEAAVRHHRSKRLGGQQVPYHGPFASIPPSTIRDLVEQAKIARAALAAGKGGT